MENKYVWKNESEWNDAYVNFSWLTHSRKHEERAMHAHKSKKKRH